MTSQQFDRAMSLTIDAYVVGLLIVGIVLLSLNDFDNGSSAVASAVVLMLINRALDN
jgi:hypothetical protein